MSNMKSSLTTPKIWIIMKVKCEGHFCFQFATLFCIHTFVLCIKWLKYAKSLTPVQGESISVDIFYCFVRKFVFRPFGVIVFHFTLLYIYADKWICELVTFVALWSLPKHKITQIVSSVVVRVCVWVCLQTEYIYRLFMVVLVAWLLFLFLLGSFFINLFINIPKDKS